MNINSIQKHLHQFAEDRNWDRYHSPKNLAMALVGETGELIEIFQWLTEEESKKEHLKDNDLSRIREELADIMIYLIRLCDKLNINLESAVVDKMAINEKKYPVNLAKDNATKYNRR